MREPAFFTKYFDYVGLNDATRAFIIEAHTAPSRHYHGLGHLALMLNCFPEISGPEYSDRVSLLNHMRNWVLATLFHDIIYDPTRSDNEENSAMEAKMRLAKSASYDLDLVIEMILATRSHVFPERKGKPRDSAIEIFLRADLGILWHPDPHVYRWYARGIRKEYAHVPNDQYRIGRTAVLERLANEIQPNLPRENITCMTANFDWEYKSLLAGELDV